jgi:hypothetical protein
MTEPLFMKLYMYVMAPEPVSAAYFINPSHQSACLYVYRRVSLIGNGSVDTFPWQRTHATIEELLKASFPIRSVSYQRESVGLCIPISLLDNGSVKMFLRQGRIVGGAVFYAVRDVSKESMRLILPRTSCFILDNGRN